MCDAVSPQSECHPEPTAKGLCPGKDVRPFFENHFGFLVVPLNATFLVGSFEP